MYVLLGWCRVCIFFFFKQKTAYEMRISDWSSDVCSSDLRARVGSEALVVRQSALELLRDVNPMRDPSGEREAGALRVQWTSTPEIGRASCRERVCQYV